MPKYKNPRKAWFYSNEFKIRAVKLSFHPDNKVKDVAEGLGMGAWAIGNFENDDALDWVSDIVESSGIEKLLFPINAVLSNQEYLESPICSEALVSIEIISAYKNVEFSNIPEEVKVWLSTKKGLLFGKKPEFTSTHINLAKQALEKIVSASELKELWQDSEHFEEWCSIQNKLGKSLGNA